MIKYKDVEQNKKQEIAGMLINILRDADIETAGGTGIEARIDNIDELADRIVKLFATPVVIDTVCCENCLHFHPDTKTCDKTCIEYDKFKQQT
jgi:hypothetical protein